MLRVSISRLLLRAKADATEVLPRPPARGRLARVAKCPLTTIAAFMTPDGLG